LEHLFPIIENFITFIHSVKIPRGLAKEDRDKIEFLHFFVNNMMKSPVIAARTIPKFGKNCSDPY